LHTLVNSLLFEHTLAQSEAKSSCYLQAKRSNSHFEELKTRLDTLFGVLDTVKKIKDDKKYDHAKKEFKKMIEELNKAMSGKNDLEAEKQKL
jgi:hypothetical protein